MNSGQDKKVYNKEGRSDTPFGFIYFMHYPTMNQPILSCLCITIHQIKLC